MALAPGTYAVFNTTEGKITVRLFEADAPITVKNFIELAEGAKEWTHPTTRAKSTSKLFDGTIFHRVIPDFMIQGGDPAGTGMGGPGYRFQDETKGSPHKFDKPGKLAMANSGPEHQRLPVLHHRRAHRLAHRQPHHLRRSGRGPGHRRPRSRRFRAAARTSRTSPSCSNRSSSSALPNRPSATLQN